jgi:hypothetical protein
MTRRCTRPGPLILLLLLAAPVQAGDDLEKFLNAIPDTTNTLTIIRMRSILQSPRGQREGWAQKREAEYLEGAVLIPPSADVVVVATKLVPGNLANSPMIGFIPLTKEVDNKDFLAREKGEIQYVAGETVFRSSRNAYYVGRGTNYLAVVSPADRQELAQWIKFAKRNKEPVLSPYLLKSAEAEASTQIMVAIDPEDLLEAKKIEEDVRASKALAKESKADVASVVALLQKLKGIRFTAQVNEDIEATLRLDFDEKVGREAELLKPYLLEVLGELGAELDDFAKGKVVVEEKAMLLTSTISLDDLKHVLSLVVPPLPKIERPEPPKPRQAPPPPTREELELKASRNYYQAVNRLIDELQRKSRNATDYARDALWHETYAKRIEQLATENVDPELLRYGANEASKLRALADSLNGVAVEVDSLQSGMYYRRSGGVGIGFTRWGLMPAIVPGGGSVDSNVPQIRTMQAEAVAKGAKDRQKIWGMLNEDRSSIRNKMQERFKVDFDAR